MLPRLDTQPVDKVPCGICRRQFSKYTCPTCNITYCSLTCFRSDCSETFYRKEIASDIQTEPSKSTAERLQMMELLKRFEEDSAAKDENTPLEGQNDDEEDDRDDELLDRFSSMDFEATSPDEIWGLLTPEERVKFMKLLDDPTSELAQQLLASEVLEEGRVEPWWEAPSLVDPTTPPRKGKTYGSKPTVIASFGAVRVPSNLPSLLYNICAVCIAYAYVTRHLAISPIYQSSVESDTQEARLIFRRLVPFVVDAKSRTRHTSLTSVVTDIWSRFEENKMTSDVFSILLTDAAHLLRPALVTTVDSDKPKIALVLSDLSMLLTDPAKPHPISHKLAFYVAHVATMDTEMLMDVVEELELRAKNVVATDVGLGGEAVGEPESAAPLRASIEEV